jgi:hypothetical protein
MIEFVGPLQNLLQHFTNHCLRTWHSVLLTTILFELNRNLLLAFRYTTLGRTTEKTHLLPTNGCPLLLRIRCRGMCLLSSCLTMDLYVIIFNINSSKAFVKRRCRRPIKLRLVTGVRNGGVCYMHPLKISFHVD